MHDLASLGRFDGKVHRFDLRVYFEDTDLSGVVYHANYLRFMERGRSDMLHAVGVDQRAMIDAGEGVYAIAELALRFRAPARFDDDLTVVSRVKVVRASSTVLRQDVMRGDELLCEGDLTCAFLTLDGRPRRQPREWVDRFRTLIEDPE